MKRILPLIAAAALLAATPAFAQLSLGVGANGPSGSGSASTRSNASVGADVGVRSQVNSRADGSSRASISTSSVVNDDTDIGADAQSSLRPTIDTRNSTTGSAVTGAGVSASSATDVGGGFNR